MKENNQVKEYTPKFLRRRKFLMILPLLVFPFITMAFWALGGGISSSNKTNKKYVEGFNLELPGAKLKEDKGKTKLSFYLRAEKDSMETKKRMRSDPYYNNSAAESEKADALTVSFPKTSYNPSPYNLPDYVDSNEEKVYQKLNELNKQLANSDGHTKKETPLSKHIITNGATYKLEPSLSNRDIDRLEGLMKSMGENISADGDLEKIASMMDKILDIQHPERVKERTGKMPAGKVANIYSVTKGVNDFTVSLLSNDGVKEDNSSIGFIGLDDGSTNETTSNTFSAVIHHGGVVENGSVVKLRLTQDVSIKDQILSAGNFLYGTAAFNGERLYISINSIRISTSIFPVKLEVYDLDGLKGLYIPGVLSEQVVKASSDNALSALDFSSMDPSLKAQAANAGISAVKSLLGKKVKKVKVSLAEGYQVLLKEE